eukprot:TRINITY_DN2618_c0_g1_i1.p1 TRINITY_DN2618_c0_g1~~TRINITY_DN2618_c0_g1_i1.p1  ORF type:complete len:590 (+),score=118.74 TRINITY_DN2618_c0_g1_i1:154-1770(+)
MVGIYCRDGRSVTPDAAGCGVAADFMTPMQTGGESCRCSGGSTSSRSRDGDMMAATPLNETVKHCLGDTATFSEGLHTVVHRESVSAVGEEAEGRGGPDGVGHIFASSEPPSPSPEPLTVAPLPQAKPCQLAAAPSTPLLERNAEPVPSAHVPQPTPPAKRESCPSSVSPSPADHDAATTPERQHRAGSARSSVPLSSSQFLTSSPSSRPSTSSRSKPVITEDDVVTLTAGSIVDLRCVRIAEASAVAVLAELAARLHQSCGSVKEFYSGALGSCRHTPEDVAPLLAALELCPLEVLDLSGLVCPFDTLDMPGAPEHLFLKQGTPLSASVTTLLLGGTFPQGLPDAAALRLFKNITGNAPRLRCLGLGGNRLGSKGVQALTRACGASVRFEELDLSDSLLAGRDDASLPNLAMLVRKLRHLWHLNLSGNCIGSEGTERLAAILLVTPSLRILQAEQCAINPEKLRRVTNRKGTVAVTFQAPVPVTVPERGTKLLMYVRGNPGFAQNDTSGRGSVGSRQPHTAHDAVSRLQKMVAGGVP